MIQNLTQVVNMNLDDTVLENATITEKFYWIMLNLDSLRTF